MFSIYPQAWWIWVTTLGRRKISSSSPIWSNSPIFCAKFKVISTSSSNKRTGQVIDELRLLSCFSPLQSPSSKYLFLPLPLFFPPPPSTLFFLPPSSALFFPLPSSLYPPLPFTFLLLLHFPLHVKKWPSIFKVSKG